MKRLVLVGGGHAHVEVLRRFGLRREPGVEITLINAGRYTVYSGMLPGLVTGTMIGAPASSIWRYLLVSLGLRYFATLPSGWTGAQGGALR